MMEISFVYQNGVLEPSRERGYNLLSPWPWNKNAIVNEHVVIAVAVVFPMLSNYRAGAPPYKELNTSSSRLVSALQILMYCQFCLENTPVTFIKLFLQPWRKSFLKLRTQR
jgi:hypothetical protein